MSAKAQMTETVKSLNAEFRHRFGLAVSDVIKDVHDDSLQDIQEVADGQVPFEEYVAGVGQRHGLVRGDPVGNAYRIALGSFARDQGWESGTDGRIYSEQDGRLVRLGVDDAEGVARAIVAEVAAEYRLEVGEDGFVVPAEVPFREVCRGMDIGETIATLERELAPRNDQAPSFGGF